MARRSPAERLRWGADAPDSPSKAKERLIDAAEACIERFGPEKTTVDDVATEAKVSRATVYRYFPGRDDIFLAVLMREAKAALGSIQRHVSRIDDPLEAIVESVVYTMKVVRRNRHLEALYSNDIAGLTARIAGASDELFDLTREFLTPLFEAAARRGQLRPDVDYGDATEWVFRILQSLLAVEGRRRRTQAETRRFLRSYLVPSLAAAP